MAATRIEGRVPAEGVIKFLNSVARDLCASTDFLNGGAIIQKNSVHSTFSANGLNLTLTLKYAKL